MCHEEIEHRKLAAGGRNAVEAGRTAICLVGAARRFELTGPSIVRNVLAQYPQADLFLSPMGIQGLLQYFNLVQGCMDLIKSHESRENFTYDWIVRTRVDGFWAGPLEPSSFIPNTYVIPEGSRHGGLNDSLGIGKRDISAMALSRLSTPDNLVAAGYSGLNSETAFLTQMKLGQVSTQEHSFQFCIMSDRRYSFPPSQYTTPVASLDIHGPLNGAKCRPCRDPYVGQEADEIWAKLDTNRGWVEWRNGALGLCNATSEWEKDWGEVFDVMVGPIAAAERKRVAAMSVEECVSDLGVFMGKTAQWKSPDPVHICQLGLAKRTIVQSISS
uniref:DUF7796 domain-containing protein n=1 Tax=Leersia perrieri TaxID=77586 RepID=A0A0D9X758_9ORYZ